MAHRPLPAILAACASGAVGAGSGRQRLQLVRLYRRVDHRGLHQGDRHQGRLRRLRFQRDPRDQAAGRRQRLRHRRADEQLPRPPDRGRRLPEARQVQAAQPHQHVGRGDRAQSRNTIRATNIRSTTCGAPSASATTQKKVQEALGIDKIDSWDVVLQAGKPRQARRLRRLRAGFAERHDPDDAELSRPRSREQVARRISPRPRRRCWRSVPTSASSIRPNTSTRSPMATSAWRSAGPATCSRRATARPRPIRAS